MLEQNLESETETGLEVEGLNVKVKMNVEYEDRAPCTMYPAPCFANHVALYGELGRHDAMRSDADTDTDTYSDTRKRGRRRRRRRRQMGFN